MGKGFKLTTPTFLRENVARKGAEIIHEDGKKEVKTEDVK